MSTATADIDVLDAPEAAAKAVRGSMLRSGGYVLGVGLSLISAPLLVRHLGIGDFGAYVTITAIVTIVAGVSDVGITSVGVREWAVRPVEQRRELMANLLGARLSLTLAGCVGAVAFGVAAGYGARRLEGIGVACVGLLMLASYEALGVPLQAELRQGWIALAEVLRQIVQVTCILILIAVGAGLVPLLATAIPAGLTALALTARVRRDALVRPAIHPRAWWRLLRDTLPFAMASALGVVYLRTTVVITSLVADERQTGYFAAAFRVMEVLIGVPVLLIGALFPVLARAAATDRERLLTATVDTLQVTIASGALVAVSVAAGAPLAIEVLVGAHAEPAVDALRILGVGLGFSFIGATCQFALLAQREHRAILGINALALLVNLVLTLALAPHHGAHGAALALAISEATVATSSTVLLARSLGGLPIAPGLLLRIALAAGVGVAAALALSELGSVPEGVGAPLVCLAAALALGALPRELLELLPGRKPRAEAQASREQDHDHEREHEHESQHEPRGSEHEPGHDTL
ncbi:MAG TPA: oligosaccharide flippase family protein [Solirubrobacteraceae bacterium]|nr:oligosaccharide flippase family protein [Solirubrobacteraceae bacterium]